MSVFAPPNWRPLPPLGPHFVAHNALYRAAALSHATVDELASCPTHLTWIDLRTKGELEMESRAHLPRNWRHIHEPFMEVDVRAGQADASFDELVTGAISFGDHYCRMLDLAPSNVARVVRAVGTITGPVVIGCQGGRDRTGLVSAILLLIAGAKPQLAIEDYLRTNDDLAENLRRQPGGAKTQELLAMLDLECRAEDIAQAIDYLISRGGVRGYLSDYIEAWEFDQLAASIRVRLGADPEPRDPSRYPIPHTEKEEEKS